MKRTILFLTALFLTLVIQAQTSKTITNITSGSLITHLTSEELSTIDSLILSGTIDASDFKILRDNMPKLTVVDLTDVTIAEYIGKGGTSLFMGEPVQDITYPANTIPDGAFYEGAYFNENKNLSSVILPVSITSIGNSAFLLCNNLSSVNIPASVTSIGDEAFSDCTGLTSITAYPTSPIALPSVRVFLGVDKTTCTLHVPLKSLSLYQSADVWKDFLNVVAIPLPIHKSINNLTPGSLITHLTPEELNTIDSLTLSGIIDASDFKIMRDNMPNLTLVDLTYVTIAEYIGKGGTSLLMGEPVKDITYPANTIPDGAFYEGAYFNENKNLSSVILPVSITSIGNSAFLLCNNLSSIIIPASVTFIGYQAFKYCNSLTSITIPATVTSIGDEAFSDCIGLTSIVAYPTIPVALPSANVFYWVDKTTCTLSVPTESIDIYKLAPVWKDFLKIEVTISSPIKNRSNSLITVWPNPAINMIFVTGATGEVSIYNSNGRLEKTQSLGYNSSIDISLLTNGMYVLVADEQSFKIIKKQ